MKKKILFINGHLIVGGVERSLVDVLRHLDYDKYDVDLLLLEGYGDYLPEIPQEVNVMMYPLNDAGGPLLPTLWKNLIHGHFVLFFFRLLMLRSRKSGQKVMKYARLLFRNGKKKYDVVVGYRPEMSTFLAAYTFRAQKRVAWWHHGEMNIDGKQLNELGCAYEEMNDIIVVSKCCAQMLIDVFPYVRNKVKVIPNMLCREEIRKKARAENIQMATSVFNIVSVGRMSPEKNMMFCVDVAQLMAARGLAFHWYLIGDGDDMEKIARKIKTEELESFFTLTGRLTNPYPYIQSADLLFHPSLVESQGLTILEAMALGTPVVVVESAGPKEFVENGRNGILIAPDVDEAVREVSSLYYNEEKRKTILTNASRTIQKFVPEEIMGIMANMLTKHGK